MPDNAAQKRPPLLGGPSLLLLVLMLLTTGGCEESAMDSYNPDQLTAINVVSVDENTVRITFSTMLESAHYCPGVNASEESDQVYLAFVRCSIGKKCSVTHESRKDDAGQSYVIVKNSGKPISIRSEDGTKRLYPEE